MIRTRAELKRAVERKLGPGVLADMLHFLHHREVSLWGEHQPRLYLEDMLLLTLYKDLENLGFKNLEEQMRGVRRAPHNTMAHNAEELREHLYHWAKQYVTLGTLEEWRAASADVRRPGQLTDKPLIWVDTKDSKTPGRFTVSARNINWSHKTKTPAVRFLTFRDGKRRYRLIMGPYAPKYGDTEPMKFGEALLDDIFAGAALVGDKKFWDARPYYRRTEIIAPQPEPRGRKRKNLEDGPQGLTPIIEKRNRDVSNLRARVEHDYARLDARWKALSGIFWEEQPLQHKYLFWIACGVENFLVDRHSQ